MSSSGDGGAIANHGNLWLEGSTIANSRTDGNHSGGAIFSDGPVTITDSLLQNNTAGSGGALFANSGQAVVTISDSTFSGNQAVNTGTGYGGAIWAGSLAQVSILGGAILSNTAQSGAGVYLSAGAALTLTSSGAPAAVSSNTAQYFGGGIDNEQGTVTLNHATLSGNGAISGGGLAGGGTAPLPDAAERPLLVLSRGGAIFNHGGWLTLTNATLSDNHAVFGGGISDLSGAVTATNATLSGNSATQSGGGILNASGTVTLSNITLPGNSAPTGGGLVQSSYFDTETLTLQNTLIASGASGANCYVESLSVSGLTSGGYNLSSDATCAPYFQPSDQSNANANLGPLTNNGGPTLTQMPQAPSPAIDAIPLGVNGCGTTLTTDQRGARRPINGKCDIGAVEYGWLYRYLWLPFVRR